MVHCDVGLLERGREVRRTGANIAVADIFDAGAAPSASMQSAVGLFRGFLLAMWACWSAGARCNAPAPTSPWQTSLTAGAPAPV